MKNRFTLTEMLIVVSIFSLLAAIAIPSFVSARNTSRYNRYCASIGVSTPDLPIEVYLSSLKEKWDPEEPAWAQVDEEKIESYFKRKGVFCKNFPRVKTAGPTTVFDWWCRVTGNPKELTVQEFACLRKDGLIQEFSYDYYRRVTGNKKQISEEEFKSLYNHGLIDYVELFKKVVERE